MLDLGWAIHSVTSDPVLRIPQMSALGSLRFSCSSGLSQAWMCDLQHLSKLCYEEFQLFLQLLLFCWAITTEFHITISHHEWILRVETHCCVTIYISFRWRSFQSCNGCNSYVSENMQEICFKKKKQSYEWEWSFLHGRTALIALCFESRESHFPRRTVFQSVRKYPRGNCCVSHYKCIAALSLISGLIAGWLIAGHQQVHPLSFKTQMLTRTLWNRKWKTWNKTFISGWETPWWGNMFSLMQKNIQPVIYPHHYQSADSDFQLDRHLKWYWCTGKIWTSPKHLIRQHLSNHVEICANQWESIDVLLLVPECRSAWKHSFRLLLIDQSWKRFSVHHPLGPRQTDTGDTFVTVNGNEFIDAVI